MPSIELTIVRSSASGAPRYSGSPSQPSKRGSSSSRFHTVSERAERMSQTSRREPKARIALDASCAGSLREHLITATSRYAGIDTVLTGLAPAFDLEAVTVLYNERWGSRASGITLIARSIHDVDYHPSTRCRVTH